MALSDDVDMYMLSLMRNSPYLTDGVVRRHRHSCTYFHLFETLSTYQMASLGSRRLNVYTSSKMRLIKMKLNAGVAEAACGIIII